MQPIAVVENQRKAEMSTKSLARTITELERERARLRSELDAVNAALEAVGRALNGSGGGRHPAKGRSDSRIARGRRAHAAKSARRSWFGRDEAGSLLKKAARKPMAPADLVRELARMKGYDGHLAKDEMRRFQGAAFMAISQALKTGTLKRQGRSGLLVSG
jgi:hypothetical protein